MFKRLDKALMVESLFKRNLKTDFHQIELLYNQTIQAKFILDNKKHKNQIVSKEDSKLYNFKVNSLNHCLANLPNYLHPNVPSQNHTLIKVWLFFDFSFSQTINKQDSSKKYANHLKLADDLDLVEFNRAGKVAGSGFYYLKNHAALLELALINYTMDILVKKGFTPYSTPDLIRRRVLDGCGFNPKTSEPQTYFINKHLTQSPPDSTTFEEDDPLQLCLTATQEFPLAGLYMDEVIDFKSLPIKMVGFGHSFRAEGLAGSLNRGLYRVHQFTKVEMFALTSPETSDETLAEFVEIQEEIYSGLGLCFRILDMPATDLGAPAYRKFDLEAWMPGRSKWGEISSASNCTDYQSQRLSIKYTLPKKPKQTPPPPPATKRVKLTDFVHTVNGTAVAVPRLILAILENFQLENGDVVVPERLRRFMVGCPEGMDRIKKGNLWGEKKI